ncbi:HEPN domain-containing protein [Spirosoma sp. KUDC1026]|uniref:HEPN domain-containing protein n=1 Tax=Spirosoma sp. KUDC1026 TaxID=2745947 RepID=UPI00159BE5C0|nr:HEPN domain-containing protein [Spirosoma sp. KUDC1026]QKZ15333.1 HEPN domain-containing protein [Spirosoma sp. KUDC1026]
MSKLYEAQLALERAEDTLEESVHNLDGGFTTATANRAYYVIFYCLTALLYTEGVQTKRHSGAQGKFHELFIRTARFPHETINWIQAAFQLRQAGDYDLETDISMEEAKQSLDNARQFYLLTKAYIDKIVSQ